MSKLAELKKANELIAAKMATGKFQDTGKKYVASEAVADSNNSSLRLTAVVDNNGNLSWKK